MFLPEFSIFNSEHSIAADTTLSLDTLKEVRIGTYC